MQERGDASEGDVSERVASMGTAVLSTSPGGSEPTTLTPPARVGQSALYFAWPDHVTAGFAVYER